MNLLLPYQQKIRFLQQPHGAQSRGYKAKDLHYNHGKLVNKNSQKKIHQ
jgi:hypothetical protein